MNNWTKCFVEINAIFMRKTSGYKTIFVTFYRALCSKLHIKDPPTTHNIMVTQTRNQMPCVIVLESYNFNIHGRKPLGLLPSQLKSTRLLDNKVYPKTTIEQTKQIRNE